MVAERTSVRISDFGFGVAQDKERTRPAYPRLHGKAVEAHHEASSVPTTTVTLSMSSILRTDLLFAGRVTPPPPPPRPKHWKQPAPPFIPSKVTSLTVGNNDWPYSAGPQRAGGTKDATPTQTESHQPAIGVAWLVTGTVERRACCRRGRTSRLNFGLG